MNDAATATQPTQQPTTPQPGTNGADPTAAPSPAPAQSWARDDWREAYAKSRNDDGKLSTRLNRYASPDAALDALISAQNKISAGELRTHTPFPTNGSDEQKAEWRRGAGIPEAADKYAIELGAGLVIGDSDKPVVESFLKAAHSANVPQAQVNSLLKWYFEDLVEGQTAERQALDDQIREKVDDQLHVEWGADYRKNKALIEAYLDTGPPGIKDALFSARLADGTPLASNADVLRFLADKAREYNPTIALVPGDPSTAGRAIGDELMGLKALMGNRLSEYWKGPKAQQNQERYRQLLDAQNRIAQRNGGAA